MSDYSEVERQLGEGVPAELLCTTCPWDRLCVAPPSMSKQEVERQVAEAEAKDVARDPGRRGMPIGMLMTALALGGRADTGQLCPVFKLRLRGPDGRQVADGIRTLMRAGTGGGS